MFGWVRLRWLLVVPSKNLRKNPSLIGNSWSTHPADSPQNQILILKSTLVKCSFSLENNKTEAIICDRYPSDFNKLVSKAKKLRLLSVYNHREGEVPEYLSNELRFMFWENYPASPFPESFQPRKLVVLRLEGSLQEELWRGNKSLPCLKELQLHDAHNLVRTPDFGGLPCLEKLILESCYNLEEIHPSFGNHTSLVYVYLEDLYLNPIMQPSIFYLPRFLRKLSLSNCLLEDEEIPYDIGELSNLQELDLSGNQFSRLNFSLLQLSQFKLLNLERCYSLVELPELPTSIAILIADWCPSLKVVGDIHTNCKWLCQVSLRWGRSLIGGDRLLQSMLQGNAIENGCMSLHLEGLEIPKGFIPPLLLNGKKYRLQLPENWYNRFSGFLMCAVIGGFNNWDNYRISMKHEKGVSTGMDSQEDVYWEESVDDEETWVGYVSFGSLKHTLWWDPTSTAIQFSSSFWGSGVGVSLVSKRSESGQSETTTDSSSEFSNDYTSFFSIEHDSKSHLWCGFKKYKRTERFSL